MSLIRAVTDFRTGFLQAGIEPPTEVRFASQEEGHRFLRALEKEISGYLPRDDEDTGEIRLAGIAFRWPTT